MSEVDFWTILSSKWTIAGAIFSIIAIVIGFIKKESFKSNKSEIKDNHDSKITVNQQNN